MYIRKLKNGNYKFREIYKNPLTGKYQEANCTFGKNNNQTRKQAQLVLDEKIRKKLQELQSTNSNITFYELSAKYLEMAHKQLSYNTWYRKQCTLGKINDDWGHDLIANKITPQFINKYLDNLLYSKNYSNDTVASYKSCIDVCYKLGRKYGYVSKNPITDVQVTWRSEAKKRRNEIENKYLEKNEFQKIIKDCEEQKRPDLKDFFTWMYLTGMRCGEAAAIQKKNIIEDKDGNYYARVEGSLITIRNEKDKNKRHRKSNSAKTYAGNRDVLLPPAAVKIAKNHCKGKKSNDYIFVNEWSKSDGYFINSKLNKVLKSIMKRQNIKKNLVTHIFRHTHVSMLADMGVPLYVIQRRVGHGDSRVTREIYLHVTKQAKKELAQKLDKIQAFVRPTAEKQRDSKVQSLDRHGLSS
ncbi:tyrosine-type recombinase/integrase [Lactobacillus crispatus]|uniref:Tyrosine-type recombinase/integrase n=2 Tax=Lactobacillus TaxID=1578 RepID=A0A7H9E874_9LACO|nr:site-specific integrase [Lactobacillus crispatus]QLL73834.1 tyrosine-type recombinase/integrase [Lactobacillus crispatus]